MTKYTRVEIDLKRLLKRCENIVADDQIKEPYAYKTFQKFLYASEAMLIELEAYKKMDEDKSLLSPEVDPAVPPKEALQEYRRKIDSLKDLCDCQKMTTSISEDKKTAQIVRNRHMSHAEKNSELEVRAKVKNAVSNQMREALQAPISTSDDKTLGKSREKNIGEDQESEQFKDSSPLQKPGDKTSIMAELLEAHIDEREKMTDDMEILAKRLKELYLNTNIQIQADNSSLDKVHGIMEANLQQTVQRNESMKELKKGGVSSTLTYFMLILIVIVVFFGLYFWIKMFPK